LWGPIVAAAAMVIVGAMTLAGTFRTSGRGEQTKRDMHLDDRADRQYAASQAEVVRLTALVQQREEERDKARTLCDEYREKHADLRVRVRAAGFDPETIGTREGGA
jgi:hypothetical protein